MTIIEKVEKALEFLKNPENATKTHELQNYAGVLGQCMGALGGHHSMISQYSTFLQQSIPVLLALCSHNSAEVRLVADEALNRVVISGAPFHSSKVHLHLHNNLTSDKHPRWLRAVLSRICLGQSWLRAGAGRGRIFAQSTLIRLRDIVESIKDPATVVDKGDILLMECLEVNLPRIMKALSAFATKDEMFGLLTTLVSLVESPTPSIRRNSANCIAELCQYHPKKFIMHIVNTALNALQEKNCTPDSILGWFGTLRATFHITPINSLNNDVIPTVKYMMIYQMCLHYIEVNLRNHNVLNAAMDCLNVILMDVSSTIRSALLNPNGPVCLLNIKEKVNIRSHQRSLSSISMVQSIMSTASSMANISDDVLISEQSEILMFRGHMYLDSISQSQTPHRSMEDLHMKGMHTPDSPCESMMSELNSEIMTNEQFSLYVKEKLAEKNDDKEVEEKEYSQHTEELENLQFSKEINQKINIGTFSDSDVPLKYCSRLLISRFLLAGYPDHTISDKVIRVSVKASALSCLTSILDIYPEIFTMYLGIHNEGAQHNVSGNSEQSSTSNNEQLNDFVLERNVCYQESLTDSFGQELLTKSIDMMSQASGTGSNKSGLINLPSAAQKRDKYKTINNDSMDNSSSLAGVPSNILDSKQNSTSHVPNQMVSSCMSGDSINLGMTGSNFTMGSNTTASNYPASTDLLTTSIDPLTSSLDLEMIFDHFGESSTSVDNQTNPTEIERKQSKPFNLEHMIQGMFVSQENVTNYDRQISNESNNSNNNKTDKSANVEKLELHKKDEGNQERGAFFQEDIDNVGKEIFPDHLNVEPANQHISELILFENHSDPQIRGLIRVCIGSFMNSVFNASSGEYYKWKSWSQMSKTIANSLTIENLLNIVLAALTDTIHSCVNHSIMALEKCIDSVCNSHQRSIVEILNNLRHVEKNPYWLCKVNLCHFYKKLDYQRLNILISDWSSRGFRILDILINLLNDQDQRVRKAAVEAITKLPSSLFAPMNLDASNILTNLVIEQTEGTLFINFKQNTKLLYDFKQSFVLSILPEPLKQLDGKHGILHSMKNDKLYCNLKCIIHILSYNLMISQCKYFTQGCLESLLDISLKYPPTKYFDAYSGLGLLDISLELLEYRTLSLSCFETTLEFTTQLYAVEAWNVICKNYNSDIKQSSKLNVPKDQIYQNSWNHMGSGTFSSKAENFLKLTLKLLNIFIHIIQDVSPMAIQQRSGLIPPSPIRRKAGEDNQKRSTSPNYDIPISDEKGQRRRFLYNTTTGNVIPVGYFINDVTLMKLYGNLRSAFSTHKVTIDPSSSVFLKFVSITLDSLAVQLEVMSEKEAGRVAEEILFYLKSLLPLKPDKAVACVTQLLRCLFSINMTSQCNSLQQFFNGSENLCEKNSWDDFGEFKKYKFYENVLLANCSTNVSFESIMNYNDKLFTHMSDPGENNLNHRIAEGFGKNSHLQFERDCYLSVKNYNRHKVNKEWTTHKHEFSKYIKLLEPIVIQALKNYTTQNNISMQCKVLELLNQLLALRINYCFLNSDRVFIDFVLKQLENIEHLEILNCGELVRCIFTFLVHLSSAEYHTKQLMDIPKLIQLCDGLMASEVYTECIQSLHPLAYKVFVSQQQIPGQSRQQVQEIQVTKEVLFAMLQKMMRDTKVIKLISTVLIFSEEHPESHLKLSQLACDTLFQLLKQKSININCTESYVLLDKLFDCIHREVLFDQSKIEAVLRIIFDKPPNQEYSTLETKERWLATILLFLRKIIYGLAENEILLSLNYLKTSHISPAAIFFNSQDEIDPLNVQTVNENCANLSPDVIFVRFLFRVITYTLLEIENCTKNDLMIVENKKSDANLSYWYKLTIGFMCQVKHILYLKDGCRFPLLAKTAQTVLQNEQSGLNTGLYSPEENIPLKRLANICTKLSWIQPLLAIQWCHLLVRLKFIEQKFWSTLLNFLQSSTMPAEKDNQRNLHNDILQLGCFLTLCEHFVDNGLDEVINLTWLLVNRIHFLVKYYNESIVKEFVIKVNENSSASGLLLQAIAARCQPHIKGTYGIKVYKILSNCHMSQSGSLLFCICRFVGRIHVSISSYFIKLAIKRCQYISSLTIEEANSQIPLDDLQMAMEMLHKDRVDKRYPNLVDELNNLASCIYNLSPLDIPLDRHINPQNIITTSVDGDWFLTQIKNRCSKYFNGHVNFGRHVAIAKVLKSLSADELGSIFNSNEFDSEIIQQTFKLGIDVFIKELINKISEQEYVKIETRRERIKRQVSEQEEYVIKDSFLDSNIFPDFAKLRGIGKQSKFFISMENPVDKKTESSKIGSFTDEEKMDIVIPEFTPLLSLSLKHFQKMLQSVVSLFPKNTRPLSQFEMGNLKDYQTMDKYTKRCYLVFRDNVFHQLLALVQNLVRAYLHCLKTVTMMLDKLDPDAVEKIMDLFLSKSLSNNLMLFSVISLQYTSYLIKQDEEFSVTDINGSFNHNYVDHMIDLCINNASQCFSINSIWKELNTEDNLPRILSTVNCFYNYMTHILKNTLPITFLKNVSEKETAEATLETAITCDKLLTLVEYWQNNCSHKFNSRRNNIISFQMKSSLENLMVKLCRCKFASSFTLIPPLAWGDLQLFDDATVTPAKNKNTSNVDLPSTHSRNPSKTDSIKLERLLKTEIAIPIDSLQDMDILEQFLFRVNLIGWTSKKGFEEIWVTFLSALQGNGTHWAVRGMMQMILIANYNYCGRDPPLASPSIKRLKQVAFDSNIYDTLFSDVNLEKVPFNKCSSYNYSQVSIEYLRHAAGLNETPDIKVQNALSQSKKELQLSGIDINSCVHLLIDIASQVLPQMDWGLCARSALLCCVVNVSDTFTSKLQWQWLAQQLSNLNNSSETSDILTQQYILLGQAKVNCVLGNEIPDVNQLTAALSSSFAPIRIAALHSAIMYLTKSTDLSFIFMDSSIRVGYEQSNAMLEMQLLTSIKPHLVPYSVVSFNEQSLCWTALFALIKYGNNDLYKTAIDFCFNNPNHFCFNLLLRGICQTTLIKGSSSANEIKSAIFKILDTQPEECHHLLPLLLTQIYTSSDIQSSENTLEPEQLLVHLQTFACLQRSTSLSPLSYSKNICSSITHCLRSFLPPAAVLNKVVQEFLDCCRWADNCYIDKHVALTRGNIGLNLAPSYAELLANVVFEVFETSISQDQLAILNGWLFDVMGHLLKGKVSPSLTPFCLLSLISCASSNNFVRLMAPIVNHMLKMGCITSIPIERKSQNFDDAIDSVLSMQSKKTPQQSRMQKMTYNDMRLLCLGAMHSNFTKSQLEKMKLICANEELLSDLKLSLNAKNIANQ